MILSDLASRRVFAPQPFSASRSHRWRAVTPSMRDVLAVSRRWLTACVEVVDQDEGVLAELGVGCLRPSSSRRRRRRRDPCRRGARSCRSDLHGVFVLGTSRPVTAVDAFGGESLALEHQDEVGGASDGLGAGNAVDEVVAAVPRVWWTMTRLAPGAASMASFSLLSRSRNPLDRTLDSLASAASPCRRCRGR